MALEPGRPDFKIISGDHYTGTAHQWLYYGSNIVSLKAWKLLGFEISSYFNCAQIHHRHQPMKVKVKCGHKDFNKSWIGNSLDHWANFFEIF